MSQNGSGHGCHYDADGNVVIGAFEPFLAPSKDELNVHHAADHKRSEDVSQEQREERQTVSHPALEEGRRQFSATTKDVRDECRRAAEETRSLYARMKRAPEFLISCATAKVTYGRKPVPRSRATLFMLDSIRFGVTFAAIFAGLFVAINYQSFWNIAKAELAFQEDLDTSHALATLTGIGETGVRNLAVEEAHDGSLLSFLPPVGPPENRLVIPKLGKNIPIAIPAMDSLIREDWVQFEKDIQHSLRDGVVHYPGTARPGQAGNFFVTGHSSYYPWDPGKYKDVFARLHELEPGDTYSVYYGGDLHAYRVTDKKEVRPTDVSVLDQPTDARIATLMTCTPIGTTLRRLVIIAQEIDPVTGKKLKVGEHSVEPILAPKIDSLPI